jgi:hypothetical protein
MPWLVRLCIGDFNGVELWFSKAFPGFQRPSKRTIAVQLQQELNGESRRTFLFRLSDPPAQGRGRTGT